MSEDSGGLPSYPATKGIVLSGNKNIFQVECEDGAVVTCSIKGKVLKTDDDNTKYYSPLAPGDIVKIECDILDSTKGQILSLIPRKNKFIRWNIKKRVPQLLAVNIDYIVLVTTPDEPLFKPRFIDRELAQSQMLGINVLIVCNKFDIIEENPNTQAMEKVEKYLSIWENLGYKVMRISAKTGEGMVEFAEFLENKVCAFVGQSGVGKSSLINVLDDSCVLKVGSLSKKYGKGRHTTTKGELLRLKLNTSLTGGIIGKTTSIIDTPGIKKFMLYGIEKNDLPLYFREFSQYQGKCNFGLSCTHTHEEGCKIIEAVQKGAISLERYESFIRIRGQIENNDYGE